jgi:cyanophycin synthetase
MNLFNLGKYHALVDYAHNPHSYEALGGFVQNWPGERIGVVGGPGDRRDEDFVTLGTLSAGMFDRIIIKEDDDTRGRPRGDAARLIARGLQEAKPDCRFETILDETKAINSALDMAPLNGLVVILPESVTRAIDLINARRPIAEPELAPVSPALVDQPPSGNGSAPVSAEAVDPTQSSEVPA